MCYVFVLFFFFFFPPPCTSESRTLQAPPDVFATEKWISRCCIILFLILVSYLSIFIERNAKIFYLDAGEPHEPGLRTLPPRLRPGAQRRQFPRPGPTARQPHQGHD